MHIIIKFYCFFFPTTKHDNSNNSINTQEKNEQVTINMKSVVRQ